MHGCGLSWIAQQMRALISELNDLMADATDGAPDPVAIAEKLNPTNRAVFQLLPTAIQLTLLLERDPHGNVQARSSLRARCLQYLDQIRPCEHLLLACCTS